jgi:lysozyme family protein
MAQADFDAFCDHMIDDYEGPYGWDRGDAGGPTKYGITCYDLAEHLGQHMDSMDRWAPIVRAMTRQTALDIYRGKYRPTTRFDDLKPGADVVVFDFEVNSGLNSLWTAQQVVGTRRSNLMDDATVKAINDMDGAKFVNTMCDRRMSFLRGLRNWSEFRGGWTARVTNLRAYALKLAQNQPVGPQPPNVLDQVMQVKLAQKALNQLLHLSPPLDVDGEVGPLTTAAVRQFQLANKLGVNGLLDPGTLK